MPFMRGARPTPRHILAMAYPHITRADVPTSFGIVPSQLDMWGNDTYGDCVSAEEAAAKAMYSVMLGLPELFVPSKTLTDWASANGYLNGADLTPVMDSMAKSGLTVNGTIYTDGPYTSVDYTNWANLTSAIFTGPVKIGVAADQLSSTTAGQANGWYGTGWNQDTNEDHCTGLWGFGTVDECYDLLKMSVPSALVDTTLLQWLLYYTWSTVGVVDFQSMTNTTGEAWLRNPTTPQEKPIPTPTPTPPAPTPTPVPPVPTVPADAIWYSPSLNVVHNGAKWPVSINSFNDTVEIQTSVKKLDIPKGIKQA